MYDHCSDKELRLKIHLRNSLLWPIYIVNSVKKTKLSQFIYTWISPKQELQLTGVDGVTLHLPAQPMDYLWCSDFHLGSKRWKEA